jgi:uncharacterized protein with HEPN domain
MRTDSQRLQDILDSIIQIEKYVVPGDVEVKSNELIRVWVIHHLLIIGEAMSNISSKLRASHPEVPWAQGVGLRNIAIHEYFGVDYEIIWDTVERDLPPLKNKIELIVRDLEEEP